MALVPCKQCQAEIAETAKTCPKCGAPTKEPTNWKLIAGISFGVVVAFLLFGAMNGNPEKVAARRTIDECHKSLTRPGLGLNELAFIQGACDSLEAQFISKFGHRP